MAMRWDEMGVAIMGPESGHQTRRDGMPDCTATDGLSARGYENFLRTHLLRTLSAPEEAGGLGGQSGGGGEGGDGEGAEEGEYKELPAWALAAEDEYFATRCSAQRAVPIFTCPLTHH